MPGWTHYSFMWCPQDAFGSTAITVKLERCVIDALRVQERRRLFFFFWVIQKLRQCNNAFKRTHTHAHTLYCAHVSSNSNLSRSQQEIRQETKHIHHQIWAVVSIRWSKWIVKSSGVAFRVHSGSTCALSSQYSKSREGGASYGT